MPNCCDIIITRGKNKGVKCKYANKVCRHQKLQCNFCGAKFAYKHTYSAHECSKIESHPTSPTRNKINVDISIKSKQDNDDDNEMKMLKKRLELLEQHNKNLESRITEAEQRPSNIVVIGNDFFTELVEKVGKDNAVQYLTTAAVGKPLEVIDKLYLEGKEPDDYPIACRNHDHFRYRNADSKIIDDHGGKVIGNIMTHRLQNAIIMAINEIITHGPDEEKLDKIMAAQHYVTNGMNKEEIIHELSLLTNNEKHPFFHSVCN